MQRRRQEHGSPLKGSATTPNMRDKADQLLSDGVDDGEDEDEDEETLQLKLAAIEARLKIKQLQKGRGKSNPGTPKSTRTHEEDTNSRRASTAAASQALDRARMPPPPNPRAQQHEVQVPLSPSKRQEPPPEPWSPSRYTLGIDKGLKGRDVSLGRPPSAKEESRRASNRDRGHRASASASPGSFTASGKRGKSFSERMAESRATDKSRKERAERAEEIQRNRSSAFKLDKAEVEGYKMAAEERQNAPSKPQAKERRRETFSRDDILQSYNDPKAGSRKGQTESNGKERTSQGQTGERESDGEAEPYSSLQLSNRILPHDFLARNLDEKTVFRIPDLLKTVKAPDFELPEVEGDYVVFGIVASKSEPKEVKKSEYISKKEVDPYDNGLNNTNRYMAMTLTDLKWTIDLYLFDSAFPRYYRLTEGTLIAILNPTVMPPPKNKTDTNRFSLTVSSSDDTILEVGHAHGIGFCKAVRKDGKTCQSWVDARKTEFCDFHVDLQVRRAQSQRMGVNSGPGMFGPGGRTGSRTGYFGDGKRASGGQKGSSSLKPEGARYSMEAQSHYYIAPAPKSHGQASSFHLPTGQSSASLIDADEDPFLAPGVLGGRGSENKQERIRKRLANQQHERELTRKLVSSGSGGVGADYLRARADETIAANNKQHNSQQNQHQKQELSPSKLIVGSRRANEVSLSPLRKRARANEGEGATMGSAGAAGIKKTRFITPKGIREVGKDSLAMKSSPVAVPAAAAAADDDDDDLDII